MSRRDQSVAAVAEAVRRRLLPWFRRHRRAMPWRTRRTAYRVWISELMLQQTRVDTVRPYFDRWMRRFPSLRALAGAPLQDVLKQWEGLGYYARARNAHRAAREIVEEHRGRFPRTAAGLEQLPGVGPYTAAAIASLAFGEAVPVVDGNVIRVLSRVFACELEAGSGAARRRFREWADALLDRRHPGECNEAFMELGATVCLPRRPDCACCPLRTVCRARAEGTPEAYPVKRKAAPVPHRHVGAGVIVNGRGQVLLARRREDAMLGGLWEFPGGGQDEGESLQECVRRELKEELGIEVRVGPHLCTVPHAFSHFTMDLHAYWVRIERGRPRPIQCADTRWVHRSRLREFPLPRADQRILDQLDDIDRFPTF